MNFPERKTARECGLDIGDKVRLTEDYQGYRPGDIFELAGDLDHRIPRWRDAEGRIVDIRLRRFEPLSADNFIAVTDPGQLYHGARVKCTLINTNIDDGRIGIDDRRRIFVCQNSRDGADTEDRLGYKYSWYIGTMDSGFDEAQYACLRMEAPTTHQIKETTTMPSIITTINNNKLTPNERFLRKHGLKHDSGELTEDGVRLLHSVMLEDYEEKMVAAAKDAIKTARQEAREDKELGEE